VGIHPNKDVASIPNVKNSNIVQPGFNIVDGIPSTVTNNSKVNIIRRYVRKNDLDGFFGAKANIDWKKMSDNSVQRMLFIPLSLLINLRPGDINNSEILLVWFSANWLQRYRKLAAMT
jgi:hypothetical protein